MLLKRVINLCAQDKKRKENVPSGVPYECTQHFHFFFFFFFIIYLFYFFRGVGTIHLNIVILYM